MRLISLITKTHSASKTLFVPDLAPLVMTEVTDNVAKVNDDCADFPALSVKLLADESGDQPLCLFLGGPAFVGGTVGLKKQIQDIFRLSFLSHLVFYSSDLE